MQSNSHFWPEQGAREHSVSRGQFQTSWCHPCGRARSQRDAGDPAPVLAQRGIHVIWQHGALQAPRRRSEHQERVTLPDVRRQSRLWSDRIYRGVTTGGVLVNPLAGLAGMATGEVLTTVLFNKGRDVGTGVRDAAVGAGQNGIRGVVRATAASRSPPHRDFILRRVPANSLFTGRRAACFLPEKARDACT